jgi:hypothetical protein
MKRAALVWLVLLAAGAAFVWWYDRAEQKPDPGFDARVRSPAFAGIQHPRVLIDEAHRNFHTASGRYKPFAELLRADGYAVSANRSSFTQPPDAEVLVIANALGPGAHETQPAFTVPEEDALVEWVRGGGALFLVADHSPFGSAAERLAQRFGVTMHLRYARHDQFHDGWDNERLDFSRANGLLVESSITNGRSPAERVNRVVTFTGQSLSGPADAIHILLNIAHWLASP